MRNGHKYLKHFQSTIDFTLLNSAIKKNHVLKVMVKGIFRNDILCLVVSWMWYSFSLYHTGVIPRISDWHWRVMHSFAFLILRNNLLPKQSQREWCKFMPSLLSFGIIITSSRNVAGSGTKGCWSWHGNLICHNNNDDVVWSFITPDV